jgi:hypothetical protein
LQDNPVKRPFTLPCHEQSRSGMVLSSLLAPETHKMDLASLLLPRGTP